VIVNMRGRTTIKKKNPYVGDQLNVVAAESLEPIPESQCTPQS
jgi:hypothetical protein